MSRQQTRGRVATRRALGAVFSARLFENCQVVMLGSQRDLWNAWVAHRLGFCRLFAP